jgi:hypothetical protein
VYGWLTLAFIRRYHHRVFSASCFGLWRRVPHAHDDDRGKGTQYGLGSILMIVTFLPNKDTGIEPNHDMTITIRAVRFRKPGRGVKFVLSIELCLTPQVHTLYCPWPPRVLRQAPYCKCELTYARLGLSSVATVQVKGGGGASEPTLWTGNGEYSRVQGGSAWGW